MDGLTRKTFTTSRSLTYTYYDTAPAKAPPADKPAILLLHGFPDSAQLWAQVVPHLAALPHRVIVPDLLGYGGSAKPTDPALYASSLMCADLAEILAHEKVDKVVSTGHDWGSYLAQRLWHWRPQLCAGVALLNVAYMPPGAEPFDLKGANDAMEAATGFPRYAYWELFTADDGAQVVEEHLESFWTVLHGKGGDHWMRDMFCVRGAMRKFLEEDGSVELREYARPGKGWREEWLAGMREGGLAAPFCWYKAMASNHQYAAEKAIPPDRLKVTVPLFFLGCSGDEVCLPAFIEQGKQAGLLPDLTVKVIDTAHWCTMENPDEVGKALYGFYSERF